MNPKALPLGAIGFLILLLAAEGSAYLLEAQGKDNSILLATAICPFVAWVFTRAVSGPVVRILAVALLDIALVLLNLVFLWGIRVAQQGLPAYEFQSFAGVYSGLVVAPSVLFAVVAAQSFSRR